VVILYSSYQGLRDVARVAQHGALSGSLLLFPKGSSKDRRLHTYVNLVGRGRGLGFPSSQQRAKGGQGEKVFTLFLLPAATLRRISRRINGRRSALSSHSIHTRVDICALDKGIGDPGARQDGEGQRQEESDSEAKPVVLFASRLGLCHAAAARRLLLWG